MSVLNNSHNDSSHSSYNNLLVYLLVFIAFILSIYLAIQSEEKSTFPKFATDSFTFTAWINAGEDYLKDHYKWITRLIASYVKVGYYALEDFFLDSSWLFISALMIIPAIIIGGLRLAILFAFGIYFWGAVDMWDPAMESMALMGLSVFLSVIAGVFLGVLCSQSNRFESFLKPFLDTMQVMPAFVYLIPAMFFFGIGAAPAILATMIYSMPPIIRLTNLGIRQVPNETIETSTSFGSTKIQTLFKVQIPLAMPSIMMGVNQTIMMALALIVLATFIGAQGLGAEIWIAIRKLDVGYAMEGGLCVLLMAIMFDRFGKALNKEEKTLPTDSQKFYLLPQEWEIYNFAKIIEKPLSILHSIIEFIFKIYVSILAYLINKLISLINVDFGNSVSRLINNYFYFFSGITILYFIGLYNSFVPEFGQFPENWFLSIREPIESSVQWLTINPTFIAFTKGLRAYVTIYLMRPLDTYLTFMPWWYVMSAFIILSWVSVGLRFAAITTLLLVFIAACNIWTQAMITLSSVMISVLFCFIIGVPIGILASYSKRFQNINEVILDAMQTLPYFCYLIPVLMFFGGGVVSALIATIIYSIPPIIRLTVLGLSQVSVTYSEVSKSFGGSTLQTLRKVKFPLAVPSLVMGFNQTVMMAFAMQIVTPLIGGKGLGKEVFAGLARSDTGRALAAGIGICLLAIIIDRISLAYTKKQRDALGL